MRRSVRAELSNTAFRDRTQFRFFSLDVHDYLTFAPESGHSGIASPDGTMRDDVLTAVLDAFEPHRLLFEAPAKALQIELIHAIGADANLGNIAPADVIGLATLRRGRRADTLLQFVPQRSSVA